MTQTRPLGHYLKSQDIAIAQSLHGSVNLELPASNDVADIAFTFKSESKSKDVFPVA